jgi:DNA-binding Lrp family transcriptional regulator
VRAYILIDVEPGMSRRIRNNLESLPSTEARLLSAETITGGYDIVALLEAEDLDQLGRTVAGPIQGIRGVTRTMTCIAI